MKPTNKKILLTVAFLATIVLVADFILFFAAEAISGTVFGITALISAPLSIVPMMFLIAPNEMREELNNASFARHGFLPRTKESTLFELASALIVVASWVIALARHAEDAYIIAGISTIAVIILLVSSYFTEKWSFGILSSDSIPQLQTRARFKRMLAVEGALYGLLSVIPGVNQTFVNWALMILVIVSFVWFIAAHFRSNRS